MRSSWPRSSSSVVSSVQARGGSLSSVSARKRSTPLPRPAAVSKRKIASRRRRPWRAFIRRAASSCSTPQGTSCQAGQAAEVTVEQTLIRAPFDAIVLTKNADVGDSSPALRAPSAEALLLGLVGGLADLAFRFTLTPSILAKTIAFALAMALIGGFLPAVRAARLEIVD